MKKINAGALLLLAGVLAGCAGAVAQGPIASVLPSNTPPFAVGGTTTFQAQIVGLPQGVTVKAFEWEVSYEVGSGPVSWNAQDRLLKVTTSGPGCYSVRVNVITSTGAVFRSKEVAACVNAGVFR